MSLSAEEIKTGWKNAQIGTECVLSTDMMSVWHLCLAPGKRILPHRHDRPYFWTVLTDGRGRSQFDNGHVAMIQYRAGDTKYFKDISPSNGFIHDLTNIGDRGLIFVTTEFNIIGDKK